MPPSYLELKTVAVDLLDALSVSELKLYDLHVWLTETVPAIHIAAAFASELRTATLAFGLNDRGQLGLPFAPLAQVLPSPMLTLEGVKIVQVATSRAHTLYLSSDGSVYASGSGLCGVLGVGSTNDTPAPVLISHLPQSIVHVAVGARHSAAVSKDGRLFVWGSADFGQLGIGAPPGNPAAVTCVEEAARVWDVDPRTGDPFSYVPVPIHVSQLQEMGVHVAKVACSAFTTVVVDTLGRVFATGEASDGQTGLVLTINAAYSRVDSSLPRSVVKTVDTFHQVKPFGPNSGAMIAEELESNDVHRPRSPGSAHSNRPGSSVGSPLTSAKYSQQSSAAVPGMTPALESAIAELEAASQVNLRSFEKDVIIEDIVAGEHHFVALDQTGDVWTWGLGSLGRLGHGSLETSYVPTRVKQLSHSRVESIAACGASTVAIAPSFVIQMTNRAGHVAAPLSVPRLGMTPVAPGLHAAAQFEKMMKDTATHVKPVVPLPPSNGAASATTFAAGGGASAAQILRSQSSTPGSPLPSGRASQLSPTRPMGAAANLALSPRVQTLQSKDDKHSRSNTNIAGTGAATNANSESAEKNSKPSLNDTLTSGSLGTSTTVAQVRGVPIGRADCWLSQKGEKQPSDSPAPSSSTPGGTFVARGPVVEIPCPLVEPEILDDVLESIPSAAYSLQLKVEKRREELKILATVDGTVDERKLKSLIAACPLMQNAVQTSTGSASDKASGVARPAGNSTNNAQAALQAEMANHQQYLKQLGSHAVYSELGMPQHDEFMLAVKQQQPVVLVDQPLTEGTYLKIPQCRFDFLLTHAKNAGPFNSRTALRGALFMPVRDARGAFEMSDVTGRICIFDAYSFLAQVISPQLNQTGLPKPPPPPKAQLLEEQQAAISGLVNPNVIVTDKLNTFDWDNATLEELNTHLAYRSVILLSQGAVGCVFLMPSGFEKHSSENELLANGKQLPPDSWRLQMHAERVRKAAAEGRSEFKGSAESPFFDGVRPGDMADDVAAPIVVPQMYSSRLSDFPLFSMSHKPSLRLKSALIEHINIRLSNAALNEPDGMPEELRNWREKRGEFSSRSFFEHVVTGVQRHAAPPVSLPSPAVILSVSPESAIHPLVSRLKRVLRLKPAAIIVAQRSSTPAISHKAVYGLEDGVVGAIKEGVKTHMSCLEQVRSEEANALALLKQQRKSTPGQQSSGSNANPTQLVPVKSSTHPMVPGLTPKEESLVALRSTLDRELPAGVLSLEDLRGVPIALVSFEAAEAIRANMYTPVIIGGGEEKKKAEKTTPEGANGNAGATAAGNNGGGPTPFQLNPGAMPSAQRQPSATPQPAATHTYVSKPQISPIVVSDWHSSSAQISPIDVTTMGTLIAVVGSAGLTFRNAPDPEQARKEDNGKDARRQLGGGLGGGGAGGPRAQASRTDGKGSSSEPSDPLSSGFGTLIQSIQSMPTVKLSIERHGVVYAWGSCDSGHLLLSKSDVTQAEGPEGAHEAFSKALVQSVGQFDRTGAKAIVRPVLCGQMMNSAPCILDYRGVIVESVQSVYDNRVRTLGNSSMATTQPALNTVDVTEQNAAAEISEGLATILRPSAAPVVAIALGKAHSVVTHSDGGISVAGRADCLGSPAASHDIESGAGSVKLLPVAAPVTARASIKCVMEAVPQPTKLVHVAHVGVPKKVFAGQHATFIVTEILPAGKNKVKR